MTTEEALLARQVDLAKQRYFNALQMALTDFQYIEEGPRMDLATAYNVLRKAVESRLPFNFDYSDVRNDALGKLISKYLKFSNNKELGANLRKALDHRNEIAHRGMLLTVEEQRDVRYLDSNAERLEDLHKQLKPYLQTIFNEMAALEGKSPVVI